VSAFGGDAKNVTAFGQSAGSISACYHLFMNGSEGLVDRIIMESGPCVSGVFAPRPREDSIDAGTAVAQQLCPLSLDPVDCLRHLPASSFAASSVGAGSLVTDATSAASVDGVLFPEPTLALLRKGTFHRVPFIGGSNAREPSYFQLFGVPRPANAVEFAVTVAGIDPDHWQPLVEHYMPATDADANEAMIRAVTDDQDRCPMRFLSRTAADLYSFEVPPAGHAQELDYVFGWPGGSVSKQFPAGDAPVPPLPDIVDAMQSYGTTFARHSDPNDGVHTRWPPYTRTNDTHVAFGNTVAVGNALAKADCDWWESQFIE
jgi:para-nitrobenzyl esterase